MAWKLNNKAFENAKKLIEDGKISDEKWEAPNLSDFKDIEEYALFHLAKDPDKDPKTASAYAYPYGKNGKVYVRALKAIRSAAAGGRGAEKNDELFEAAGKLLDQITTVTGEIDKKQISKELEGSIKKEFSMLDTYNSKEEEQIVTGPVLIPNYRDCEYVAGEKQFSAKEIQELMNTFYQYQYFDVKHDIIFNKDWKNVAELVESWQLREDWNGYPKGTWMITARITDNETWEQIKNGELTGFSVTAIPRKNVEKFGIKSVLPFKRMNRRPISELDDPVIVSISLTDRPCVYDAKIISMKEDNMKEEENVLKKIYELLKGHFRMKEEDEPAKQEETKEEPVKEEDKTSESEENKSQDIVKMITEITEKFEKTYEKIDNLEKQINKLQKEPETKEEPAKQEKAEDKPEKQEKEGAETEEKTTRKTNREPVKPQKRKALPPDSTTTNTRKTIYEILGRDALGRKLT